MQHLVKQHIFHGGLRHARMIQTAVEQNLVRPRIVAAKLPPPAAQAPADVRFLQFSSEVFAVQFVEHFFQIEVQPVFSGVARANAMEAHAIHAAARAAGA